VIGCLTIAADGPASAAETGVRCRPPSWCVRVKVWFAWLCGRAVARSCGRVVVWSCGGLVVWLCGCVWLCGWWWCDVVLYLVVWYCWWKCDIVDGVVLLVCWWITVPLCSRAVVLSWCGDVVLWCWWCGQF